MKPTGAVCVRKWVVFLSVLVIGTVIFLLGQSFYIPHLTSQLDRVPPPPEGCAEHVPFLSPDELYRYALPVDYTRRVKNAYYKDAHGSDGGTTLMYQPRHYPFSAYLMRAFRRDVLVDVGCGNGVKLAMMASRVRTVGLDLPGPNLDYVRKKYPHLEWAEIDASVDASYPVEESVVQSAGIISSDVIEHIVDPFTFTTTLRHLLKAVPIATISTPDRVRVRGESHHGPPQNNAHVQEWTLDELMRFFHTLDLNVEFGGYTINNDRDRALSTLLIVLTGSSFPPFDCAPSDFLFEDSWTRIDFTTHPNTLVSPYGENYTISDTAHRAALLGFDALTIVSASNIVPSAERAIFAVAASAHKPTSPFPFPLVSFGDDDPPPGTRDAWLRDHLVDIVLGPIYSFNSDLEQVPLSDGIGT